MDMRLSRLIPLLLLVVLIAAGCGRGPSEDERFTALADRCLSGMRELDPVWATSLGDHRFDDRLTDLSKQGFVDRRNQAAAYLDSLDALDAAKLDEVNRIDLAILRHHLEGEVWRHDGIFEHIWNPLIYNVGDAIYSLLARDFAPLPERLRCVAARLGAVSDVVAAAMSNLDTPPRVFTETAIRQNRGTISLILDDLQPFLDQAPEMRDELREPRIQAIATLESYGRWLEEFLLPNSKGNFRLGEQKFRRKLQYTLDTDLTMEEILAAAQTELAMTQERMLQVALPLYEAYYPERAKRTPQPEKYEVIRSVLERLSDDRPDNATIVEQAREDLRACTEFVRAHDLVSLPSDPVEVIVMPEFQRGVAIAYCDAAGPLETGLKTYFAIAPTPADWTAERVDSFFREYNDHMLKNLVVHEAMPGHYLQIAHANAFAAPTLTRAMLGSGVFVEGWATYAEQLMVESGFMGPELQMQQLKMRLRLLINAIIDQEIHCRGMTEDEAVRLMMQEGFQEEGEAAGKWRRACMSSTQLTTYFVGNLEVNRLRDDYRAKVGDAYDARTFHDALLSYGSPAPKYLRELMDLQ